MIGCGGGGAGPAGPGGDAGTVTVLAAASLQPAFAELAQRFEAAHPGVAVRLVTGSSSSLREQVRAGAPADVFASADATDLDALHGEGLVGAPVTFASNELVIVVPEGNPAAVATVADLADADRLVGLCASSAPCGRLAREALDRAGVDPGLDTTAPDARALLTQIASGDLDAGVVYRTDAASLSGSVDALELPGSAAAVARYALGAVADGPAPRLAAAFVALVVSDAGRAVLAAHGFGPP